MVLLMTTALGLLAALSLMEAAQSARVAALAEDELRARAAAWEGLSAALHPPDLHWLCLQPPASPVRREWALPGGGAAVVTWWTLPAVAVRAEVEGRGRAGARQRRVALLVPDSVDAANPGLGCPEATGLQAVGGDWIQPHPEG